MPTWCAPTVAVIAPIIQTLISVVAALFGIWLGTRLSRRKDQQQWRRDRCLEAYSDVLRACSIMMDQGMIDWIRNEQGVRRTVATDIENHMGLVAKNSRSMYSALDRVNLLAPTEVHKYAEQLVDHCVQFTRASLGNKVPSGKEWTTICQKYSLLYDSFKDAARDELQK